THPRTLPTVAEHLFDSSGHAVRAKPRVATSARKEKAPTGPLKPEETGVNPVRSRHCDRDGHVPTREPDTHRRRLLNTTGADFPREGDFRMDISRELAEISTYRGFFALTVGGDAAGWHPVRQSYADGCTDLIDATVRRYRTTDLRIGASLVHLAHATRLWSP